MPKNVTTGLHRKMADTLLGNSLEQYLSFLLERVCIVDIIVDADTTQSACRLSDREKFDFLKNGLITNRSVGLYLVQAIQTEQTRRLTAAQAPMTFLQAVAVARNAFTARGLVELTEFSLGYEHNLGQESSSRRGAPSRRFAPYNLAKDDLRHGVTPRNHPTASRAQHQEADLP